MNDANSMLSLYRRLIRLRRTTPALLEGSYRAFENCPEDCLVFHRETAAQHILVALNFTAEPRKFDAPPGKILMSTNFDRIGAVSQANLALAPNEAVILEVDA